MPLPRGERHHSAKLTIDQVREIRASPPPLREIAERFGVSIVAVWRIRKRQTWKHVA